MSARQPECRKRSLRVTLLKSRERPCFHSLVKTCQGLQNAPLAVEEGARKFRTKIPVHAEQILKDQYLSIASRARANADRRNSKAGANILAQYLSTDAHIGYLVMDVEKANALPLSDEIRKLSRSIRTRVVY